MPKKDLTGKKFGKLTVIRETEERASNGGIIWECQCDCGNKYKVVGSNLTRKKNPTVSCGCQTNMRDWTGCKVGKLTVIEPTEERRGGKIVWKCQCECGNIHFVSSGNLQSKSVLSCGCTNNIYKNLDLSGQIINELTVIKKINDTTHLCQCSCGNEIEVSTRKLQLNIQKSCGKCEKFIGEIINNWKILERTQEKRGKYYLYKAECQHCGYIKSKTISEIKQNKGKFCDKCRVKDLTGKVFGRLTVLGLNRIENRKSYWDCLCSCGTKITVNGSNLVSHTTKSCGCLTASSGESLLSELLTKLQIEFVPQKTFETCRFKNSNNLARFDFYLPEYNILIEYDGQQHYFQRNGWEDLACVQERDKYKNQWAKDNNIQLIRIPYFEYKNLNEEYLINKILLNKQEK